MTDTEKLYLLVVYIRDAERHYLQFAEKGCVESKHKLIAIQDIQSFMENELKIECFNNALTGSSIGATKFFKCCCTILLNGNHDKTT